MRINNIIFTLLIILTILRGSIFEKVRHNNFATTRPEPPTDSTNLSHTKFHKKSKKSHKMGHRGSKIDFNRIIGTDFDLKITFPTSIRVRNITFYRCLKIFEKAQKTNKQKVKTKTFSLNHQKSC